MVAALERLRTHNGRRRVGLVLSTLKVALNDAYRAGVNAVRVATDGRKASTLALGSGAKPDAGMVEGYPSMVGPEPPLPGGGEPLSNEDENKGNTQLTASDSSSGIQEGGKQRGVRRRGGDYPFRMPGHETAAQAVARERMPDDAKAAFDAGAPTDRHRTGKNGERWREYESAVTIHQALLKEARQDVPAIEAWCDRWLADTVARRGRWQEEEETRRPTGAGLAVAHVAMGRVLRRLGRPGAIFQDPLRWLSRERRSLLDPAGEAGPPGPVSPWARPWLIVKRLKSLLPE